MNYMLSLLLILFVISTTIPAQTVVTSTKEGAIVSYVVPITLAKSGTQYSDYFDLDGFLPRDTTKYIPVLWQCSDTTTLSLYLQVKNSVTSGVTAAVGSWYNAATLIYNQTNYGNDSLYVKNLMARGTVASGVTDMVSLSGYTGDRARIKVVFANPTTVGNSGYLRVWVYLKKQPATTP